MPQTKRYETSAGRQAAYRARTRSARQQELAAKGLPAMPGIPSLPGSARWNAALRGAHALLEQVAIEMNDWFNDRSDTWQASERGEEFTERLQSIEDIGSDLGALCDE